jgi:hypothetical protein
MRCAIALSPPHEVCDCSDQAAHYHNLGPKLGASLLTRHIGWKQKQKVKKKKHIYGGVSITPDADKMPFLNSLDR